jgi:hypothetical protein
MNLQYKLLADSLKWARYYYQFHLQNRHPDDLISARMHYKLALHVAYDLPLYLALCNVDKVLLPWEPLQQWKG